METGKHQNNILNINFNEVSNLEKPILEDQSLEPAGIW